MNRLESLHNRPPEGKLSQVFNSVRELFGKEPKKQPFLSNAHEVHIRETRQKEANQEKIDAVQGKYYALLEGRTSHAETQAIAKLLESKGFTCTLNSPGNEILWLDWPTKAQDFQAFGWLMDTLRATSGLTDQEFKQYIPGIIEHLGGVEGDHPGISPLFSLLNDTSIPRSKAHIQNPLEHTQTVAEMTSTLGLDWWETFRARLNPFIHDLGKFAIAQGDFTHRHAEIPFQILKQYLREHPLPEFDFDNPILRDKSIELFLSPVRFHHILEGIEFKALTPFEVYDILTFDPLTANDDAEIAEEQKKNPTLKRLRPEKSLMLLAGLIPTDAASVDQYLPHAIKNGAIYLDIFSQLPDFNWTNYSREFFQNFCDTILLYLVILDSDAPLVALESQRRLAAQVTADRERAEQSLKESWSPHLGAATAASEEVRRFAQDYGIFSYQSMNNSGITHVT